MGLWSNNNSNGGKGGELGFPVSMQIQSGRVSALMREVPENVTGQQAIQETEKASRAEANAYASGIYARAITRQMNAQVKMLTSQADVIKGAHRASEQVARLQAGVAKSGARMAFNLGLQQAEKDPFEEVLGG